MNNRFFTYLLSATLLALPLFAAAEDIDLFIGQTPADSTEAPNVLLILDNGANFSASVQDQVCRISSSGVVSTTTSSLSASDNTALTGSASAVEQCALYSVLKGLDTSSGVKVNIGVMGFNATGMQSFDPTTNTFSTNCATISNNGGCLLVPIVPLNETNKTRLLNWIKNWQSSGNSAYNIKGNNTANGAAMQEAWAYFNGKTGLSGRNYAAIKPSITCGKNNVIFIGNAYRNNSTPGDSTGDAGPKNALLGINTVANKNASPAATALEQALVSDTLTTSCGTNSLEVSENKGIYALNWARYMKNQSSVTTYSIGILGPTCNGEYAAHLTKLGDTAIGGGHYFPTNNYQELVIAMNTILGEIQSVNSVFAAVSLPISVNTQGTYLNQVFVGMFRPDSDALPRWDGNLKQYRLGMINNDLKLLDADTSTVSAINSQTGFVTECARSYWTPTTIDSYWDGSSKSKGGCTAVESSTYSNYPDGNIVEKGAQAYVLRNTTPASRNVKTCSTVFATCGSTTALTSFDTSNTTGITQNKLDATSGATNRSTLINWARGQNISNELEKGTSVMRPSVHGDVVHSRPVAINHGTDASPQVIVYYGANDGMLRAINGNRTASITLGGQTYAPGSELWSFMPPEFYSSIKRLYDNNTSISYKGSTVTGALPKPYGFDGPVTGFQGTVNGVSKTLVFAAMRRGGRALYAFDVTSPASPTLLWKKGCPNNFPTSGTVSDTECSNDGNGNFSGIGQTWSSAKPLYASGHQSGTSPLLMMGGGYDTCEDTDNGTVNHNCSTATTKGNKIYVMDAVSGALVKTLDTDRSVTGDVTIVKDGTTGMAQYAYATDLGGNVYRISGTNANSPFASTAPSNWTITKIASLGCDTVASCSANRKFMYAPDVVYDNGVYILLIGSGDREKPLSTYTSAYGVANHFFMIKDNPTSTTWLSSESATCSGTSVICKNSLVGITDNTTPSATTLDAKKGWYLTLAAHEQVVTSSVTVFGVTTFSTHQPAVTQTGLCGSNLGTALVYNIAYADASTQNGTENRYERVAGGGLPPSPVAGRVTLDGTDSQSGETVAFCIGCTSSSSLEGKLKKAPSTGSASQYKSRVYWYIEQ